MPDGRRTMVVPIPRAASQDKLAIGPFSGPNRLRRARSALAAANARRAGRAIADLPHSVDDLRHLGEGHDHWLLERPKFRPFVKLDRELVAHRRFREVLQPYLDLRISGRPAHVATDSFPRDDAGGRRHLVVGLKAFLDSD